MSMAEAARRLTWSSMAMEFDPRIFDVWSWDAEKELLAGVDVDRTAQQTTAAILPPQEGLHLRSKNTEVWQ